MTTPNTPTASRVLPGSHWRHNTKGGTYRVALIATDEATLAPRVIYRRVDYNPHDDPPTNWDRPLAAFADGRFTQVEVEPQRGKLAQNVGYKLIPYESTQVRVMRPDGTVLDETADNGSGRGWEIAERDRAQQAEAEVARLTAVLQKLTAETERRTSLAQLSAEARGYKLRPGARVGGGPDVLGTPSEHLCRPDGSEIGTFMDESDAWQAAERDLRLQAEAEVKRLTAENERLTELLNSPETEDFLAGVLRESGHQRQRWGDAHDREKSAENWHWLIAYLAGKALRAHITGDMEKAKHHTISTAGALAQWHAFIKADTSGSGLAADPDLHRIANPQPLQYCTACNGNDGDAPCAFPGEGKPGCLRDKRLQPREQPSALTPDQVVKQVSPSRIEDRLIVLMESGRTFFVERGDSSWPIYANWLRVYNTAAAEAGMAPSEEPEQPPAPSEPVASLKPLRELQQWLSRQRPDNYEPWFWTNGGMLDLIAKRLDEAIAEAGDPAFADGPPPLEYEQVMLGFNPDADEWRVDLQPGSSLMQDGSPCFYVRPNGLKHARQHALQGDKVTSLWRKAPAPSVPVTGLAAKPRAEFRRPDWTAVDEKVRERFEREVVKAAGLRGDRDEGYGYRDPMTQAFWEGFRKTAALHYTEAPSPEEGAQATIDAEQIWVCKIGGIVGPLPNGADRPLRQAVQEAFRGVTGLIPEFVFSGWDGQLDRVERDYVEGQRINRRAKGDEQS